MQLTALAITIFTLSPAEPAPADGYAELLAAHVRAGRVDYKGLATPARRKKLDDYLASVAKAEIPGDRLEAIGFLVDAYNALVLRAVLEHGRPRSVLDVRDFFSAKVHEVARQKVSLDELEKQLLVPRAKDPRVHMALVCGAVSCPWLDTRPYRGAAAEVDRHLDEAARRYLASTAGATVKPGELALSKLFDWYAADFGGPAGAVSFVRRYLPADAAKALGDAPKVTFLEYNWTLNQQ